MRVPDTLEQLAADTSQVFGDPYQTPDGATVIPVSRVKIRKDGSTAVRPRGIFVVNGGQPTWCPVVDTTRIAFLGEFIGLVAATLSTAAMVRRPPWPDVRTGGSRKI